MTGTTDARPEAQRCQARKADGSPCTAKAAAGGVYCIGHRPEAAEARRRGGKATSKRVRMQKMLPSELEPIFKLLRVAVIEAYEGKLDARRAAAVSSLAGALVKLFDVVVLEQRLRLLEDRLMNDKPGGDRNGRH